MNNTQKQQAAASQFAARWKGRGYEKGESQTFWLELLRDVLNVPDAFQIISFESQVKLSHTSFIDAYIRPTRVLIEQKSIEKDLRAGIRQSDGSFLTPFQQAKRYASELPLSKHPRWVVVSNFRQFFIYDMEQPQSEPEVIELERLPQECHRLRFLVDDGSQLLRREMEVSIQAGELVGRIYDAFLAEYGSNPTPADLHALNVLCVRLVFCLYAEDAGVFEKDQFYHYLQSFRPENMRQALQQLFQTLDTPVEARSRFLEEKLQAFPYVNGSLFRQQPGEDIPPVAPSTARLLLDRASIGFDWSEISPTIFGAVFESTLNPETRRSGGMHYTSIENIHRVIDPLFLDRLTAEFEELLALPHGKTRTTRLEQFQQKLASLRFLDPACGSGNFLTETYISLRRLENRVITVLLGGEARLGFDIVNPIRVSIQQFYGIEVNDFAVTVATTALWIAEAQMMNETERIISFTDDYLPLKPYHNIRHANALQAPPTLSPTPSGSPAPPIDHDELSADYDKLSADHGELSADYETPLHPWMLPGGLFPDFIIGNPPFVGGMLMSKEQKEDTLRIFGKDVKGVGELDYVACWYKLATDLMLQAAASGRTLRTALVSTNSITQGEQVATLWEPLMAAGVHIDFAWRTFRWDSESTLKAHVHCVIIGFSVMPNSQPRRLHLSDEVCKEVENINGYLTAAPNVFIHNMGTPLCDVPPMNFGNMPRDGGGFILSEEEKEELIQKEPLAEKWVHLFPGAKEFLNNGKRYCLWLQGANPAELRNCPTVMQRVESIRKMRADSKAASTRKMADTPTLFAQITQPLGQPFIIVPRHSSENRRYIPLAFMGQDVVASDSTLIIPSATLYHFGVLTSNVHMAWMRAVCGRLKSDYRYSKDIVYNNFPWPSSSEEQRAKIEQTAQAILDARALYPTSSLADLYDEVAMPPELRQAHQQNDRAVMQAYGFKPGPLFAESDCVAALFRLYQALITKS